MKITVPVTDNIKLEKVGSSTHISYSYPRNIDLDYTTLDDAIILLKGLKTEYGDIYENLEFRMGVNCSCYGCCDCSKSPVLYGTREESDIEKELREQKDKDKEEYFNKKDREEYERLKKKFD